MGLLDLYDDEDLGLLNEGPPAGLLADAGGGIDRRPAGFRTNPANDAKFHAFFAQHYAPAAAMARQYGIDVALPLGLAAYESQHGTSKQAKDFSNPFGIMKDAVGTQPRRFDSLDAAWDGWGREFGARVLGVGDDPVGFIDRLQSNNADVMGPTVGGDRRGKYNSANPAGWEKGVGETIESVRQRLPGWLAKQPGAR